MAVAATGAEKPKVGERRGDMLSQGNHFEETAVQDHIIDIILKHFRYHGGEHVDTPVLEPEEVAKLDSETKTEMRCELKQDGNRPQSLRDDLTVPLMNYLATRNNRNCCCYQLGKVFRRDKTKVKELYMCDFDIVGNYDRMIPDAECLTIIHGILKELQIGEFLIKVAWAEVRNKMVNEKGISPKAVDLIEKYFCQSGTRSAGDRSTFEEGKDLIKKLLQDPQLSQNEEAMAGLSDLKLLFEYLPFFGIKNKVVLDLSLVPWLKFYTGIIYRVSVGHTTSDLLPWEVARGGRYDELYKELCPVEKKSVPCVGFTINIQEITSHILKQKEEMVQTKKMQVLVASKEENLLQERIRLASELWSSGIKAQLLWERDLKEETPLQYCRKKGIPHLAVIGEEQLKEATVELHIVDTQEKVDLLRGDLVKEIQRRISSVEELNS
nr:PREDICTED: histidine--tRNA ligase, cytoplasmic-like isoform X2 [Latimeria chalumnae]|eukprot:XP_006007618.1 PREDICTED: histidine--tRNA ligase, cytoplasmic-like isoform X2 [Latimeria chalumnae]